MRRMAVVFGVLACLIAAGAGASPGPDARASFSFKEARLQDAIRLIAGQYGLNVVIGRNASGTLTATLTNVTAKRPCPWSPMRPGASTRSRTTSWS